MICKASAGGDLSARGVGEAAAWRLREEGHAQKVPSRAGLPSSSGNGTCGDAARSQRAQKLTKRAKSARAVEEKLRGYGETGHVLRPKAPELQPYLSTP